MKILIEIPGVNINAILTLQQFTVFEILCRAQGLQLDNAEYEEEFLLAVKTLLAAGAAVRCFNQVDSPGGVPLLNCVQSERVTRVLLKAGADPNCSMIRPLRSFLVRLEGWQAVDNTGQKVDKAHQICNGTYIENVALTAAMLNSTTRDAWDAGSMRALFEAGASADVRLGLNSVLTPLFVAGIILHCPFRYIAIAKSLN